MQNARAKLGASQTSSSGGAIGSAAAGYAWIAGGWNAVCALIGLIGSAAILADWTYK